MSTQTDRDHLLAELLADLTDRRQRGEPSDPDSVTRDHPELREELNQLWAMTQVVSHVALGSGHRSLPESSQTTAETPAALPRSFGDYELLAELGRGGMGIVYKAREKSLDRTVALKMVLRGELASPEALVRFRTEARAAAALNHENIVPVYTVSEQDGQPFYTMQFVEGTTLTQKLASGPLPDRTAARYLLPVAEAVDHAHRHGILHRDLKPSNVLIDALDRPQVADFGLAKRIGEPGASATGGITSTGAILGTPSYLAPEQAAGSRGIIGPASDVYSLGAILYEMLTGRPPFQAASALDTLLLVLEQEPVPLRALNPKVDRDLEMICLKCLQKPPDLRYSTAAALAADLRAYLEGEPVSVRSTRLASFIGRVFRETHHAAVLQNWGLLWMWHSLATLILCIITNSLAWAGVENRTPYILLWTVGLMTWGMIFWWLRRRAGPVTSVERQIAHFWAAGVIGTMGVFFTELALNLKVLTLSPILAVLAGMVFLIKGGMLSGTFYFAAAALFLTAIPMALFPQVGPLLFGLTTAACFFFPGLKYYKQKPQ
jgi:serine/threonine-protein kinase